MYFVVLAACSSLLYICGRPCLLPVGVVSNGMLSLGTHACTLTAFQPIKMDFATIVPLGSFLANNNVWMHDRFISILNASIIPDVGDGQHIIVCIQTGL